MKPYLISEPYTNELYEALIVLYRSFGRVVPPDINDQEKLLLTLINAKIAKFLVAEKDKKMARHILELRRGHVTEAAEPVISMELLRKYISYAKQQVEPALTDEAMERIEAYYLDLRKDSDDSTAIAITPRYLEAIIRLSEAQARMALKDEVTIDHVEAAINLLRSSLEQVGKDPVTGKVDIDFLLSGTTKASRSKMQTVIDLIKEESRKGSVDIVAVKKVKELAKENNIEEDFVDKVIEQLRSNGEIYSPRDGYVKLA